MNVASKAKKKIENKTLYNDQNAFFYNGPQKYH